MTLGTFLALAMITAWVFDIFNLQVTRRKPKPPEPVKIPEPPEPREPGMFSGFNFAWPGIRAGTRVSHFQSSTPSMQITPKVWVCDYNRKVEAYSGEIITAEEIENATWSRR